MYIFIVLTIACMILLSNFAVIFENSSRVTDYTIFTLPRSIEGCWDLLVKLNIVESIPNGSNLVFAISIATGLLLYKKHKTDLPKSYSRLLEYIYGKNI
jgi:hypothetical protein